MVTAQFGRLVWPANSRPQFMARLIRQWETTYSMIKLALTVSWRDWASMGSLSRENWVSFLNRTLIGNWSFRQMKDAFSIAAVRRLYECVRSLRLIRGLTSNLSPRRFHESMIREIAWK